MSNHDRRFDPKHHATLSNTERKARWQPLALLQSLGIQPAQAVLELGCGPGFWALPHRLDPQVVQHALQTSGFRLLPGDGEDQDAYLILAEIE